MAGTVKDGMRGRHRDSLSAICTETVFSFYVTDSRFNGTLSVNRLFDGWRDTAFLTIAPGGYARHLNTAIVFVDKDNIGSMIGQVADLLDGHRQGVTVADAFRRPSLRCA